MDITLAAIKWLKDKNSSKYPSAEIRKELETYFFWLFERTKKLKPEIKISVDTDKYPLSVVYHYTKVEKCVFFHSNIKEIINDLKDEYLRALQNLKVDQRTKDIQLYNQFIDSLSPEQLEMYNKVQYKFNMPYG